MKNLLNDFEPHLPKMALHFILNRAGTLAVWLPFLDR